ncbi:MAG TPA: tetratricopeptide repeat protein [Thermoanaerobaculia bacterium]|nr:tetratricopeptide repeat protein [Thermoanaerobaculia bacterium]
MPQRQPGVPPPFDEGVFLMHYNLGREAFAQGRFGQARSELELAQRFRPDDPDVLNLLGLVYFKTSAYAEAEVIYRALVKDNESVFILHSNLGLVLFKQGKLDQAEEFLLRSVELRPNYAKSHLYLGLLYKQKGKLGLALEHLRFAGAEKAVRELEAGMRNIASPRGGSALVTGPIAIPPVVQAALLAGPSRVVEQPDEVPRTTLDHSHPREVDLDLPPGVSAARKLQEAVEEPEDKARGTLDLGRKIEGASKTFSLHENGVLEINFERSVHLKRGTVSSYTGNLRFSAESGLVGTTAQTLVRATGHGRIFLSEKGRKTFLLDLADEFIYVEGGNLLALEDSLSYRVDPIYDASYQKKIDTVKIFGRGSLAISTSIEPLTLRVTRDYPLSISSNALVAWTGELIPAVLDDDLELSGVMIKESDQSFKVRFEGDGVVVSEQ